jgi:peptide/nickel transport system substrate-binding protein
MTRWLAASAAALVLSAGPALAQQTTLNIGMASADVGRLDPHNATTTPDKGVLHYIFSGLVRIKPGEASPEFIEPDIAESWESSEDGLTWTFQIRDDVACHGDYGTLTAEDVVWSLERAVTPSARPSPTTTPPSTPSPPPARTRSRSSSPARCRRCSASTSTTTAATSSAARRSRPWARTSTSIRSAPAPSCSPNTSRSNMSAWSPTRTISAAAPHIKEINYRYIPSDASRDLAFQSGELDMIYGRQDETWVDRISQVPGTVVTVMSPGEMSVLSLNMTMPPLDDVRVRRAIAHALDRDAMVAFRGPSVTRPSISPVPEGYLGYTSDVPQYEFDIERAKELLAEAGHPDGVTINTIHTTLPGMLATIEVIQALLAEADINLTITQVEHATFHAQIREDLSQLVHYSAARFPIADVYLTQFYYGPSTVGRPTAVTNFSHCDVADEEIEAARVETDTDRQLELWATAQQKIMEEVCAIPVYENLQLWAWKDTLDLGTEVNGSLNLSPPITEQARFTE